MRIAVVSALRANKGRGAMKYPVMTAVAAVLLPISISALAQQGPTQNIASSQAGPATATSPDVNLTPRRIVFGPRDRAVKEITVFNRTNATATYNIVLTDQVMTPGGSIVSVDKAPAEEKARLNSALPYLRYSPRQMTLGPQESQTVRLQARPPAGGGPAEYRTHFSVTATPPPDTGVDIAAAAAGAAQSNSLQVRITPVYGIMIPIIIRTGDLSEQTSISNAHLVEAQGKRAIGFTINRSGGRSVYGGIDIFLEGSGSPKKIGGIRGLGVYTEINHRDVVIPLDADAPAVGRGSRVKIVYTDDELNPGTILAQTEATLS
jgi:hypothetical protein